MVKILELLENKAIDNIDFLALFWSVDMVQV